MVLIAPFEFGLSIVGLSIIIDDVPDCRFSDYYTHTNVINIVGMSLLIVWI